MDEKIKAVLEEINNRIPKEWRDKLMKKVVHDDGEALAREALESPKISAKKKKKIREFLAAGKFRKEYDVLDEKIAKKIDKFLQTEVKKAIADGLIPDPASDPFIKERAERIFKGEVKKAEPLRPEEIKHGLRNLNK